MKIGINQEVGLLERLDLSPEERLLILCARLRLTPEQRDELEALVAGPLSWELIVHKVRWHLFSLLFQHLRGLENRDKVPAEVMDWLKNSYVTNVARSLFFQNELRQVLEALRSRGLPVVVLKGAVLAEMVYGCSSLRPMTDVDLLVHHQDAGTADAIVRSLGYVPSADPKVEDEMRAQDRQLARLAGVGKPVIFDIHSHIVEANNPLRFDISGFWERAVPATVAGVPVSVLCPEDFVTHLTINFFKDLRFNSFAALGELCDLSETVRLYSDNINWDLLVREVRAAGLEGPVFCGLYLAQQVTDAPIPDKVLLQLQPDDFDPRDAERLVRQRVLGEYWVAKALVDPRSPYSWRTVTLGMLRRVFPSRHSLAEHYDVPVQSKGIKYLYFRRLAEALSIATRLAVKPGEMREDLAVDRWLHSLYGHNGCGQANSANSKGTRGVLHV